MSVRVALLAILTEGSCYGYQLRTELDRRTGSFGPINVGQIYNTLDRLDRDKLVRKVASNYYEITDAGEAEVRAWFATGAPADHTPSELAEKISLAASLRGVDAAEVIRVQRTATEQVIENLDPTRDPRSAGEVARTAVVLARAAAGSAELRFLDEVELLLARAGQLGIMDMPLTADVPKRGRPAKAR